MYDVKMQIVKYEQDGKVITHIFSWHSYIHSFVSSVYH